MFDDEVGVSAVRLGRLANKGGRGGVRTNSDFWFHPGMVVSVRWEGILIEQEGVMDGVDEDENGWMDGGRQGWMEWTRMDGGRGRD